MKRTAWLVALMATAAAAQPAANPADTDLLRRIVEVPSVYGRGTMPKLTSLIKTELGKAGITDVRIIPYTETQMVIARWPAARPSGKKPILLMAHMDVVEAKASDWTRDPFKFVDEGGYYYGRGVNDNKAGLTALILTMQRLKASGFQPTRDIILLFTGDEETSMVGAKLAATQYKNLIDAEYALNSDGGGGTRFKDGRFEGYGLQLAEKSYADYHLVATNPGGHSSRPRPDNAIYQLAHALTELERYRFPPTLNEASKANFEAVAAGDKGGYGELLRGWLAKPDDRVLSDQVEAMEPGSTRTRCVATMLSGGHATNALPQRAEANVNCRIMPGVDPRDVQKTLQSIAGPDVQVSIVGDASYSNPSPLRADIMDAYKAALKARFGTDVPVMPNMSTGATDGKELRKAGIPTYGLDALWTYSGESYGVHGLNERIPAAAFHDQMGVWADMIRRLAG